MSSDGFVTVYSDASFCERTLAGGWAVWLRSEHGRVTKAGVCPEYVTSSLHAELVAAFAGIWLARYTWPATTAVLVKTDCRPILEHASGNPVESRDATVRMLCAKVAAVGVDVIAKWTPGHSSAGDMSAWINGWCDIEARGCMRQARKDKLRAAQRAPLARPTLSADDVARIRAGRSRI